MTSCLCFKARFFARGESLSGPHTLCSQARSSWLSFSHTWTTKAAFDVLAARKARGGKRCSWAGGQGDMLTRASRGVLCRPSPLRPRCRLSERQSHRSRCDREPSFRWRRRASQGGGRGRCRLRGAARRLCSCQGRRGICKRCRSAAGRRDGCCCQRGYLLKSLRLERRREWLLSWRLQEKEPRPPMD